MYKICPKKGGSSYPSDPPPLTYAPAHTHTHSRTHAHCFELVLRNTAILMEGVHTRVFCIEVAPLPGDTYIRFLHMYLLWRQTHPFNSRTPKRLSVLPTPVKGVEVCIREWMGRGDGRVGCITLVPRSSSSCRPADEPN